MPWSFLEGFFYACFYCFRVFFSIAKQTDKNITFLYDWFWCLLASCGISMDLLPSKLCFLSIQYLNVFLQPAFQQLIKFWHFSILLLLNYKWTIVGWKMALLFTVVKCTRLLIVLKGTKFCNCTKILKKLSLVDYFHYN